MMRRGMICLMAMALTACAGGNVRVTEVRTDLEPPAIPSDVPVLEVWPDRDRSGQTAQPQGPTATLPEIGAHAWIYVSPDELDLVFEFPDEVYDPEPNPWEMWKGDCIQIALDPEMDRTVGSYDEDDTEIGLGEGEEGLETVRWKAPGNLGHGSIPGDRLTLREIPGGRLYGYSLPLSQVPSLNPVLPGYAGFTFALNDRDGDGERKVHALTPGLTDSKDPSKFAVLKFPVNELLEMQPVYATLHLETRVVMDNEPVYVTIRSRAAEAVKARLAVSFEGRLGSMWKSIELPEGAAETRVAVNPGEGKRFRMTAELYADGIEKPLASMERVVYGYETGGREQ